MSFNRSSTRWDPIAAVEASYALDRDRAAWLNGVARAIEARLPADGLFLCGEYAVRDGTLVYPTLRRVSASDAASGFDPGSFADASQQTIQAGPGLRGMSPREYWARGTWTYSSLRGQMGSDHPVAAAMLALLEPFGLRDSVALLCRSGIEEGVFFAAYPTRPVEVGLDDDPWLLRLSLHVATADRLRRRLGDGAPGPSSTTAEAVFAPDGRTLHALGAVGRRRSLRDRLRERVRAIDRARGNLRRKDAGEAIALWQGLVDGTWSLVDAFDSDGRRFVVAHRNPPELRDPRALTPRERQVARLVSLGHGNAVIAYGLGISESAVGTHVGRLLRKLRCQDRGQLIATLRATREAASLDVTDPSPSGTPGQGPHLAGGAARRGDADVAAVSTLTEAERNVLNLLLDGWRNREIAARRGVGPPTIAKQVTAIYRKLGVQGRAELFARLGVRAPER